MSGGGWGNKPADEDTDIKPQVFTDADAQGWLDEKKPEASTVCMAFYGWDGVCKTGVAIDCYAKDDQGVPLHPEKKIVVLDLDGSADPIRIAFHSLHPNISVVDPMTMGPSNEIDYVTSYNKILKMVTYLLKNEKELQLHAVILDGMDTLLKTCEYVMRFEDLKTDPDTQIKDSWQWSRRNRRHDTILYNIRRLKCAKFFTTHYKELKEWKSEPGQSTRKLTTRELIPDWGKATPGVMYQKVLLRRSLVEGVTTFEAVVEKAKGKLELEGKTYTIATVVNSVTSWKGLREFYRELGLIKDGV